MKRYLFASILALFFALAPLAHSASAQTGRRSSTAGNAKTQPAKAKPQATAPARQLIPLPASDAVLNVNVRRVLAEAIPRALAGDAAKLADVNADIEQFKTRTGIDARAVETMSVGVRFTNPSSNVTKIDHIVAVARGTFNSEALVAAGRLAAQGRHTQQQHAGKAVHVFGINNEMRLFGLFKFNVREMAVSVLDANTLAFGEPEAVRAAIDAQSGRGRIDAGLLDLAGTPNDIIGFAGNMPSSLVNDLDFGMPEITRSVASIKRFYGGLAMAGNGFQMLTVLRTTGAADAKSLGETIESVRQIAPGLISMSGGRGRVTRSALENLKVTAQGNEVQLRLELSQSDFAALTASF